MPRLKIAKNAGFCMGVKRAVELANVALAEGGEIYTFGPLIHNSSVVNELQEKGAEVIYGNDPLPESGSVVIRSHGATPDEINRLKASGLEIIDATCPRVIRIQRLVHKCVEKGESVILYGDKGHGETKSIMGFSDGQAVLVENEADLEALLKESRGLFEEGTIHFVSQTTKNRAEFEKLSALLEERFEHVNIHRTICDCTENRQEEIRELRDEADLVVVVGGKNSANTTRLFEIAAENGKKAVKVEGASELSEELIGGASDVVIVAGASTPLWTIREVAERIRDIESPAPVVLARKIGYYLAESYLFFAIAMGLVAVLNHSAINESLVFDYRLFSGILLLSWGVYLFNYMRRKRFFDMTDRGTYRFLARFEGVVRGTSILLGLSSLFVLYFVGFAAFAIALICFIAGFSYGRIRKHPFFGLPVLNASNIREIRSSAIALLATAGIPATIGAGGSVWEIPLLFVLTGFLLFSRFLIQALLDFEADFFVTVDSLPGFLGIKKARMYGTRIALAMTLFALAAYFLGAESLGHAAGFASFLLLFLFMNRIRFHYSSIRRIIPDLGFFAAFAFFMISG